MRLKRKLADRQNTLRYVLKVFETYTIVCVLWIEVQVRVIHSVLVHQGYLNFLDTFARLSPASNGEAIYLHITNSPSTHHDQNNKPIGNI